MKLREIITHTDLKPLHRGTWDPEMDMKGCYIGDLLSNVMAKAQAGDLWLTVQTHSNVVAIAVLLNLAGIVIVEGHLPQPQTLEKAQEEGITLLGTSLSSYELACRFASLGVGRKIK